MVVNSKLGPNEVVTFLSCSIRAQDRELVKALDRKVLSPLGFRCVTLGRGVSLPEQVDDAIRRLIKQSHCLIGVATARLDATDRHFPDRTLALATEYLLQEASMAFQAGIPHFIFKTPEIELQGVLKRNLWIEIEDALSSHGRIRFRAPEDAVRAALEDLKSKALQRKKELRRKGVDDILSTGRSCSWQDFSPSRHGAG